MALLKRNAALQRPDVMAEMEWTGGPVARQDDGTGIDKRLHFVAPQKEPPQSGRKNGMDHACRITAAGSISRHDDCRS
ncbi:hypothetical protein RsS62_42320 [Rhizobium dioscoreae]|nr:hypothetical protein RsS62_42320 [Rhizobium dioscoreae]